MQLGREQGHFLVKVEEAISFSGQHWFEFQVRETIVAVNNDRAAPIFGVADLGVVGDLHAIVPELEKRLLADRTDKAERAEKAP